MEYSFNIKLGILRKFILRRFKFRLQSVLNLKEKKLEDERMALAQILRVLEDQKDTLLSLNNKKEQIEKSFDNANKEAALDIQNIVNARNYLEKISNEIKTQFEIIKKTQIEFDEQTQKVNEAYKELKVLEKLKEKQYEEFLKEFRQNETKELDDIVISRYKG